MLEANRSPTRALIALTVIAAIAFTANACGSDSDDGGGSGATGSRGAGGTGGSGGSVGGAGGGNAGTGGGAAAGSDAGSNVDEAGDAPGTTQTFLYVTNELTMPTSRSQFAIDLNGDANADNNFGAIVGVLAANAFDFQGEQNAIIAMGEGLELLALGTSDASLAHDTNSWIDWYRAQATPSPDFTGSGIFAIDSAVPSARLFGQLANAMFQPNPASTGVPPTTLVIRLGFFGDVPLILIPAFAQRLDAVGNESPCSSTCAQILQLFDTDGSGTITATEVASNALVSGVFAPDVDLLDAFGNYAPDAANVNKDCLSVGIGFTAVKAIFTS